ncbi:hypothetical protein UNDYM_5916 (plasmid) [Undibacterium sp. YM2]|uniref:DUF6527 family protein n=1 Tax=Undibacterium sp. YM2 TaxID=2058625 RepID=UPI001331CBF4|nr:DUF6527 family protein [Undibacterium sp. YM2]BBB70169.1 hypothetical protein UNDYM_5916 [Undibacterium sp. YM2]
MRLVAIRPKYVQHVPDQLEEGVLYISERFRICSHLCACGCKEEVVTPLSHAEWHLFKEGELVSLLPSIGNWNYDCKSHYFIEHNGIRWLPKLSAQRIKRVQQKDALDLKRMLDQDNDGQKSGSSRASPGMPLSSRSNVDNSSPTRNMTLRQLMTALKNIFR